jgi:hypothetical protein
MLRVERRRIQDLPKLPVRESAVPVGAARRVRGQSVIYTEVIEVESDAAAGINGI